MAGVSSLLKAMLDRLLSTTEEMGLTMAVGEELDRLRGALSSVRASLEGTEQWALDGGARWLPELRKVLYDADDAVDEFEYKVLESKVVHVEHHGLRKVRALLSSSSLPASDKDFVNSISEELQKIRKRLEDLAMEKQGLLMMNGPCDPTDGMEGWEVDFASAGEDSEPTSGEDIEKQITNFFSSSDDESPRSFQENVSLSTILGTRALARGQPVPMFNRMGSTLSDRPVLGREKDLERWVELLRGSANKVGPDVTVAAMVGLGGVGKTILSRSLFNHPGVTEDFHLKIWVCVSADFDVRRLIIEILEAASPRRHDLADLSALQHCLEEVLGGKRFLLILDDVWNEDYGLWEKLRRPLLAGGRGSVAVVTTRSVKVAEVMGTIPPYLLMGLANEDCWRILEQNAFAGEDPREHPNLEMIGRSISAKLNGLPVAAKTLGPILKSKLEESFWKKILESELWDLKQGEDAILPALRLSCQYLPSHLKLCFSYCSLFPKRYVFEKANLVQLWIAEGFVQQQGTKVKPLEDQGSEYFDYLVSSSFFRHFGSGFVMHDLVHDLARSISRDVCVRIEHDNFQRMSENFHHVSLVSDNLKWTGYDILYKQKRLRTLLFLYGSNRGLQHIPCDLFSNLKSIRVLDLSCGGIDELPDSIYDLKHLRYLDLSHNNIESLSESLGRLLRLQMLNIDGCQKLQELPRGMSKLVNLRHLKSDPELLPSITRIGMLTSLQELQKFKVSKRAGHKIVELKDLSKIRGALCICNLENVGSRDEAHMAKLNMKAHLYVLGLEWAPRDDDGTAKPRNMRLDEEVLEGLRPHPNVKVLNIRCYDGVRSPSWMDVQLLPNLETIVLQECQRWEQLPPLGELSRLKLLRIEGLKSVRQLGRGFHGDKGFPSLEELQLYDMNELEDWSDTSPAPVHGLFPSLRRLDIRTCPKLMELPQTPLLMELKLVNVGLIELPNMWLSDAMVAKQQSSLKQLCIADCPNLISLTRKLQPFHLKGLERLSLTSCKRLEVLPEGWFVSLLSLKRLTVEDCPRLKPSADGDCDLPPSLMNLKIGACPTLVSGALCRSVQSLLFCSSVVSKHYPDLTSCAKEVLQHLVELQVLNLHYRDEPSSLLQDKVIQEQAYFSYVVTNDHGQHEEVSMPSRVDLEVRGPCSLNSTTFAKVIGPLTSLKFLQVSGFQTLTSLSQDVLSPLTALRCLTLSSCKELVSLMVWPLCSLECLRVQDCPRLTSISDKEDRTTLKVLILINCTSLPSLPSELKMFSSLEYLHIENCTHMRSLPDLPASLKELVIEGCLDLTEH